MNTTTPIPIDPITKIKTIVYTKMEIKLLHLAFGENIAEIQVIVYDDTLQYTKSYVYPLTDKDYTEWTSDEWLIKYIRNKLRLETFD